MFCIEYGGEEYVWVFELYCYFDWIVVGIEDWFVGLFVGFGLFFVEFLILDWCVFFVVMYLCVGGSGLFVGYLVWVCMVLGYELNCVDVFVMFFGSWVEWDEGVGYVWFLWFLLWCSVGF